MEENFGVWWSFLDSSHSPYAQYMQDMHNMHDMQNDSPEDKERRKLSEGGTQQVATLQEGGGYSRERPAKRL